MAKRKRRNNTFETIHCLSDIPDFQLEDDEHAFWATHEFGEELLNAAKPLGQILRSEDQLDADAAREVLEEVRAGRAQPWAEIRKTLGQRPPNPPRD
jgi:hypothetical protein